MEQSTPDHAPDRGEASAPARSVVPGNSILVAMAAGVVAGAVLIVAMRGRAPRSETSPAVTVEHTPRAASRSPETPPLVSPVSTDPKWTPTRQARWGTDGSRTMGFELAAERDVPIYRDRVRPILAARCISRQIQMFVVLRSAASVESADLHTVRVRVDDDPPGEEQWIDSSDKQALFAPDGGQFARRLANARRLQFGFTPYNAAPASVDFDVHGFDRLLDTMTRTCGVPRRT